MSYTFFAERLQQRFRLSGDSGVVLELLQAERTTASMPGVDAYNLLFSGPLPALPQATYTLEDPEHGALDIFLVPVARQGETIHYQAVFN
ncbi:DUF6916 family protein [Duganella sp. PWIR1]